MTRKLYATLVGIDKYMPPVPPLRGCVNDIEAVTDLLKDFSEGGEFVFQPCVLKNSDATRSAIIHSFRHHLSRAGSQDVALFYFSGHGSQEIAPPEFWHLEPDRLDETLVCFDSRRDGEWDLADKELALLIAEVAKAGTHVVCVLDCCHSGSGTRAIVEEGTNVRRAPTDRRGRGIETFLDGVLTEKIELSDKASIAGWGIPASGKHLLLAACRSSETAKEVSEAGKQHGAFTASFLAALRQTRGSITYRDLLKRTEAQVRLRVAQQVPQIEASDPIDLQQHFLGGATRKQKSHFTLRYDHTLGWVIDGGAIHGVARPKDDETTILAIFDLHARPETWREMEVALATADVKEVRPELSRVELKFNGDELNHELTYRAVIVATPLPALGVFLQGNAAGLGFIRDALANVQGQGKPSLLVQEMQQEDSCTLCVDAIDDHYIIRRKLAGRPVVAEITGIDAEGARLVVERVEHIARWQTVASLENAGSRLSGQDVEIAVFVPIKDKDDENKEMWVEVDSKRDIRLEYVYGHGKWQQPRMRILLNNHGSEDVYCTLLWLGDDYSVSSSLLPGGVEHIPAGKSVALNNGKPIYTSVPKDEWEKGRTEVRDMLKLIVSTEQFDATLFDQEPIGIYLRAVRLRPHNLLERLAERVHFRAVSTVPEQDDVFADWMTSELLLNTVRPLEAVQVPSASESRELPAGVTVMGHPALTGKIRLVSPDEAGQVRGIYSTPSVFRDDPEYSQPFLFQTARGTDSGLSTVQLFNVENPETVTADAPLRLRSEVRLSPGEHVIPYGWDGEFFLPLGAVRRTEDGIEIELRQLPEPLPERGFFKSIRILFQKIVSPYLGIDFNYPHLAAVNFDDEGQPTYVRDVAFVQERVLEARRILLYIHGIFGDTLEMTPSAHAKIQFQEEASQRIEDHYDLILAFDYENINSGIEQTARALKERLDSIGLGPGHDKTFNIAAHSMGGLVARWFIEREGGHQIVQHLVTLGTPHVGSPWPTIQDWATTTLALGLNNLAKIVWPVKIFGKVLGAIETIDVMLDEMGPNSTLLAELATSPDPNVQYTLLVGNTSIIPIAATNGTIMALLEKLSPQRLLHSATTLAFLGSPNDIAVATASAKAVSEERHPQPVIAEVACDHLTFFESPVGQQALFHALTRI